MFEGDILKANTAEDLANDEIVRKVYLGKHFELKRKILLNLMNRYILFLGIYLTLVACGPSSDELSLKKNIP